MKNKGVKSTIYIFIVYALFLLLFYLFNLDFNGRFYFVTAWVLIYIIGFFFAKLFKDRKKELEFEIKFFSTVTIGIIAGIISSLYTATEIKNIWTEIIVLVVLLLMYGGFLVIEVIKPTLIRNNSLLSHKS